MAVRPRSRSVRARLIAVVLLIGVVAVVAAGAGAGMRIYRHTTAITQRLDRVEAMAGGGGGKSFSAETLSSLRRELSGGQEDLKALKAEAAPFLAIAARLGWAPRVGPSLAALPHVVAMAEGFLDAGVSLLDGLEPAANSVLNAPAGGASAKLSVTERVLPPLLDAQPRLVEAQDAIERAAAERDKIESGQLLPVLSRQLDRLDTYMPALQSASQAAAVSPLLLGAARPMTYLLAAQNNDELRPTGGFISAFGILTLDKGKITRLDMMDSNAVDNWERDQPAPPEPLTRYMESELWVMRDANYWPDFPTSARTLEYFAALNLDLHPDGILTVDQQALQILVGGLGSVVIPEYGNDVLTRDNVIAKIRSYWEPPAEFAAEVEKGNVEEWEEWMPWHGQRKQFMGYLVQAMRSRLENDTRSLNMVQLGKAVLQALDEKHVLIYLHDPLGGGVNDGRWGGAIPATTGDYLFVVDTNMGFNKANGVVTRSLDYSVVIDPSGLARARLVVGYNNTSRRDVECYHWSYYEGTYDLLMNRCYWNYLRIYAPAGATLIGDAGGNDMEIVGTEAGKQVWARWMVIPPRERAQVALGYYLSGPVLARTEAGWEYRLLVQKQPGTDTTPLRVTVTLPDGMKVVSASPAPKQQSGNVLQFESKLATDEEFRIVLR